MTGTEFSIAVEEINGGDPIASTLRFQFGNLGQEPHRAETAMDDSPQDGHIQDRCDFEHMANLDRPLDHQRL